MHTPLRTCATPDALYPAYIPMHTEFRTFATTDDLHRTDIPVHNRFRTCLVFAALLLLSVAAGASPARERLRFDSGWLFHLGETNFKSLNAGAPVAGWTYLPAPDGAADVALATPPDLSARAAEWKSAAPQQDIFGGVAGFAWLRASLPPDGKARHILHFGGIDDNATVFMNGRRVAVHEGWDDPFDVDLKAVWRADAPNEVLVLVENTGGAGGLSGPAGLVTEASEAGGAAKRPFNPIGWSPVHLPHDFVIQSAFDPKSDVSHGFHPTNMGWYRKVFALPLSDKGRRIVLDFDGVYRSASVWLNGLQLTHHGSGYTSFQVDITDAARFGGSNELLVRADARGSEGWWYEGGGIYRHVWLVKTEPVHVGQWGTAVTSRLSDDMANATVVVNTTLVNDSGHPATCSIRQEVVDAQGRVTARTDVQTVPALAAGDQQQITHRISVISPALWSPESPNLYKLVTTVSQGGQMVDRYVTRFGFRTIRFDPDHGFFLNGKSVKIKGTCNHQDFAGIGVALPDSIHRFKVERLREMGCNALRFSHHPMAPELLDECDRLGMLVMDENRRLGASQDVLDQVASMVRRDRNHPSVILWSMCNEEGLQGTERGAAMFTAMMEVVHRWDTSRPISSAMNGGWGEGNSLVEDVMGCNYNYGGYDAFHKAFPLKPMFGSETSSALSTRGIYEIDKLKGYTTSYDFAHPDWGKTTEGSWRALAEREWMAGGFVWTGFDYRGEPTPYVWPCVNSHFGVMDTCGFPKDDYFYYQSWWKTKPIVHILPHWNWPGRTGQKMPVWVMSNCERVELLVNGVSQGVKAMERNGHLEWDMPYAPGALEARGYNGGAGTAATDRVETTGVPAALKLRADRTTLTADSEDTLPITVAVVDANGRVVPTADNEVTFRIEGPAAISGVGNGDPSSHEPDKASRRHAFNGRCMVLVQAGRLAGRVRITAGGAGLKSASLDLVVTAPTDRSVYENPAAP